MKFTLLSMLALAAASSVSALPRDSTSLAARDVEAQFTSLHVLNKRGLSNGHKCKEDDQCDSEYCMNPGWFKSNKCEPKLSNGNDCDHDKHCVSGYCKHTSFWRKKKCETNTIPPASLEKGAKCDRNVECKTGICEDTGFGSKKCYVKQTGESCKSNNNCEAGFCYIAPKNDSGRCLAVNLAKDKYCVADAQCASKKCKNQCE